MNELDFSILVCTRNRFRQLERLLESIRQLQIPEECSWELVIVDNASTDDTRKVIDAFGQRLPVRSITEPRPGVSHARNASKREARGKWLFCTDDDVTLPADWFVKYANATRRYPQAAFFGGDVVAHFPGVDETWIRSASLAARSAYAIFKVSKHDEHLTAKTPRHRLPFGANFAFRADVLKTYTFRQDLGRQPGMFMLGGEETEILSEIVQDGHQGWLISDNPVLHWIEADRQTAGYLEEYYLGKGWQLEKARCRKGLERFVIVCLCTASRAVLAVLCRALKSSRWVLLHFWLLRQLSHVRGRLAFLACRSSYSGKNPN